jgi:CDP-diacylglycerol--serine O-phosphatidyltransferase
MPVVLFSTYLIYGFIRPWISQRIRKEIEDFSEGEESLAPEDAKKHDTP